MSVPELDFTNVPVRPTSKKEIQQLETALIIGTIYSPEVLELIRDPLEKATWVDSLAVAAAALAREKAGYTIPQIAEELGRSEATIRSHLQGKTKAGKLVRGTYEKLVRGELRVIIPFTRTEMKVEEIKELLALSEKVKKLEQELEALRRENERLKRDLENCVKPEDIERKLNEMKNLLDEVEKENESLRKQINELKSYKELIEKMKELLGC
ncbi:MAG: transcriptional regulator [Pyrodictiaceae archaeon]